VPSLVILFSAVLVSIVRTDRQNHTHTHTHTDADDRYTHATPVGVSDNVLLTDVRYYLLMIYVSK